MGRVFKASALNFSDAKGIDIDSKQWKRQPYKNKKKMHLSRECWTANPLKPVALASIVKKKLMSLVPWLFLTYS